MPLLEDVSANAGPVNVMTSAGGKRAVRVLVTLSSLQVGGAERNVVSLLPHLRREGIDVSLCTLSTRFDSYLAEVAARTDVPRYDLDARRLLDVRGFRRFLRLLRERGIDVVHAEDQYSTLFASAAYRLTGLPWVSTRHNVMEERPDLRSRVRAGMCLFALKGSTRCITVSDAIQGALSEKRVLPADRMITIYNGIELEKFAVSQDRETIRHQLGWPLQDAIVVIVAVIREDKGHDLLFKAAQRILDLVPNLHIKVVGDGPFSGVRQQQAAALGDRVEFMGQRSDVPLLLSAADLLVMPSRNEGLPTVLIEAGAAGLPVVATDVGGTREIVEDEVTGFVVPPEAVTALSERMAETLLNPDLARRLGEKARDHISRVFTLTNQARQTAAVYRGLVPQ